MINPYESPVHIPTPPPESDQDSFAGLVILYSAVFVFGAIIGSFLAFLLR